MPKKENTELFLTKLASSGLDENDAEALGMKYLSSDEVKTLLGFGNCPALHIPYYHPRTSKPMRFTPRGKDFFRVRFLGETLPLNKEGKPQRYRQGTKGVCAYFPKNQDWSTILDNTSTDLFFTEGEFKAAKACKEGLPTIGLGGVESFQSSKYFLEFLPELEEVQWEERRVYIMFDSDTSTNKSIVEAVNRFARRLVDRGAIPFFLFLPGIPGLDKTGVDDYLAKYSIEQFHSVVMPAAMHLTAVERLWELNKRYIVINNPPCVYDRLLHQQLDFAEFTRLHSQKIPAFHKLALSKEDGKPRMLTERVQLGNEWLQWPVHMRADELANSPEGPEMELAVNPNGVKILRYNRWRGWGCTPVKGDVTPFIQLFEFLTGSLTKRQRRWFLQWLAYPLQNPSQNKMASAVILYGETQGTGKSLLGTTMQKIYGHSGGVISASILAGSFNGWLDGVSFIACDEMVSHSGRWSFSETMKSYITEPKIQINQKHVKSYIAENRANFYFTTNVIASVHLDLNDRRFFICEVGGNPLPQSFYSNFVKWRDSGGLEALFHYLKSEVKLTGFDPMARAPRTRIKDEVTVATMPEAGLWLKGIMDGEPFEIYRSGKKITCDLASASELRDRFNSQVMKKLAAGPFGAACKQAGLRCVREGTKIATERGKCKFYALRNADKWLTASRGEIIKYIKSCEASGSNDKKY